MAEPRRDPRGPASPSRWWLLVVLPVATGLSLAVALLASALQSPRVGADFTRTQRSSAVADAYVAVRRPGSNFGRTRALRTDATAMSYLRFRVRRIPGTVLRARLRVWAEHGDASGYGVRVVRDPRWAESTITAATRPPLGPLVATSRRFSEPGWVTVDVTRLIPAEGAVDLALVSRGPQAAVYDSREGRHPPELVVSSGLGSDLSPSPSASLAAIVTDVLGATRYRFQTHDDRHHSMRGLSIIQVAPRRYVGVYHSESRGVSTVYAATSTDLLRWKWRATLDRHASRPAIEALPRHGLRLSEVTDTKGLTYPSQSGLRVRHFPNLPALLSGRPDTTVSMPSSPTAGTSDAPCFSRGSARREHALAAAVLGAGASGNVGHPDDVDFRGARLLLVDAQSRSDGTSHVFLYDPRLGVAHALDIRTPRRSDSFAAPTATEVRAPSGATAVVVTLYLPPGGAAVGESGELVYYRELAPRSVEQPAAGVARQSTASAICTA